MATERKKVPARFYRSASGAEPVRDWLLELDKESRKEIGKDIATVEYGWPIGMPTCAPPGAGLYESADESWWRPHRARAVLLRFREHRSSARIHQEDPEDAPRRSGTRETETTGSGTMNSERIGSSFVDFLNDEGIRDEVDSVAQKRVFAWQIQQAMEASGITQTELAGRMHTSRTQVARLLDPNNTAVQLDTMQRAARAVGRVLKLELV
jgi:antitoxin HicB